MKRVVGRQGESGTVFILVLWLTFGLVTLALYFAHSMSLELRGAHNRVAMLQADHAGAGAARYVTYILSLYATNGVVPNLAQDLPVFRTAAVPVGESTFWLLGRSDVQRGVDQPAFGLIDEASKLNLNTATVEQLQLLPGMTPQLAASIIDWRDADSTPTENGAEDETYARLSPARMAKNSRFETVEELRLVNGATAELLFGEDANLNGILDLNENDGDTAPPYDNRDGRLNPGLLEYVTVYSRQPSTRSDGTQRINISTQQGRQQLRSVLTEKLSESRATEILSRVGNGNIPSVLQFYSASGMTADEFALIHTDISASNAAQEGLVNVNTASQEVLACIPGIGTDYAPSLVAFRASNPTRLTSMAWVTEVLQPASIAQCGRFLTDQSYQFTADVAAVGAHGRGFNRTRYVFDTSAGHPRLLLRRDFTSLGWPLGSRILENLRDARENWL